MPLNFNGNAGAINAATQLSLHSSNPGVDLTPAVGSELTAAPYARQSATFGAPVADGSAAESLLQSNVVFNLALDIDQDVQFVGLWDGATYLGYIAPSNPFNFTGTATERSFTVLATTSKIRRSNPV